VKPRENRESIVMRTKSTLNNLGEDQEIKANSPIFQNHKYGNKVVPEKKQF